MRRIFKVVLSALLIVGHVGYASNAECLEAAVDEMNDLYRTGCGCEDGIYNAISSSMLGWGVGLFVGIALLTGLVHNSHVSHSDSSDNNSSQ